MAALIASAGPRMLYCLDVFAARVSLSGSCPAPARLHLRHTILNCSCRLPAVVLLENELTCLRHWCALNLTVLLLPACLHWRACCDGLCAGDGRVDRSLTTCAASPLKLPVHGVSGLADSLLHVQSSQAQARAEAGANSFSGACRPQPTKHGPALMIICHMDALWEIMDQACI